MKTATIADSDAPVPRVVEQVPAGDRPVDTWAVSILPSGELVPDDVTIPRSRYDTSAPLGVWNSQPQRQELAIQVLSGATTMAIFVAPLFFVVLQALDMQIPTATFCVTSLAGGAVIAAVFRKKLRLGQRGRSLMRVPLALQDVDRISGVVHRAASNGGWQIEPKSPGADGHIDTWVVEKAHTLWYFDMSRPERHYLHLETIGRQYIERHARLKGLILQEVRDAGRGATPAPPVAREANPPE